MQEISTEPKSISGYNGAARTKGSEFEPLAGPHASTTSAMNTDQIKILTRSEDLTQIREYWQSVQWHPAADLEFYSLILQSRDYIESPCVFVVYRNNQPVALLAGRIERSKMPIRFGYLTLAKIPVRKLNIIEGGFMGEKTEEVWEQLLDFIAKQLEEKKFGIVAIESVTLESPQHLSLRKRLGATRVRAAKAPSVHWLLRLPKTWEEFMQGRSKKRRYWLNRLPRMLDKEFPHQWSIMNYTSESDVETFAHAAEAVACQTYHRGLGVGFQKNSETIARLAMEAKRQQLRGYILFIKDQPVAFWYCFVYKSTLYLASTGYDPSFRSYEAGTVLLLKVFNDYCGTEVATVDFGLGDADYKQRFGSEFYAETTFFLFPTTVQGLCLNLVHGTVVCADRVARRILDKLHFTQRIKTIWRRGKTQPQPSAPAESE